VVKEERVGDEELRSEVALHEIYSMQKGCHPRELGSLKDAAVSVAAVGEACR
jgi:hypothetical protein